MQRFIENNYITLEDDNFFMCTNKIPEFEGFLFTISGDKLAYLDVFPNAILSFGENSKSVYVTNDIRKVFALHERGVNNIVFVYELTHSFAKEIMDKFTASDIVLLDDFGDETSYFTFLMQKGHIKICILPRLIAIQTILTLKSILQGLKLKWLTHLPSLRQATHLRVTPLMTES